MQTIIKSFVTLLLTLFFLSTKLVAQHAGMGAVYGSMKRQFVSQRMQNQLTRSTNSLFGEQSEVKNSKYPFQVKLKDSSVKIISSQIYDDTIHHKNYLLFVDKSYPKSDSAHRFIKIYPEQTVYILRDKARGDGNDHEFVVGRPNDSCWMFKVKPNHISIYSYLSEDYFFVPSTITGIQLNDGPIVKFDEANLIKMVSNDADALNNIHDKKYLEAIKTYNKNVDHPFRGKQ